MQGVSRTSVDLVRSLVAAAVLFGIADLGCSQNDDQTVIARNSEDCDPVPTIKSAVIRSKTPPQPAFAQSCLQCGNGFYCACTGAGCALHEVADIGGACRTIGIRAQCEHGCRINVCGIADQCF